MIESGIFWFQTQILLNEVCGSEESRMMIRSNHPADRRLLLLEEELAQSKVYSTGEEALGSKESHFFACRAGGDAVFTGYMKEDQAFKEIHC